MIKRPKAEKTRVWALSSAPALRGRLLRGSALTASLLALALAAPTQDAHANPEGGSVIVGDATITPVDGGSTINVDQGSDRVVIDWDSFSIDEGEAVNFNQPGATSIALNRVTGFDTSFINGVLTADGYVFLVNPNGIVFGASALVDVGGLVASTADITNENFIAGNFDFNIASPNDAAVVANYGSITVADAGLAALVGPTVRNSGVISANLGTVGLAGARTFTLDFYGDGLFSFDTGAEVAAAAADGGALVENAGVISASGGRIFVTALGAEDIINNAINMDGIIEADTVGLDRGTIVLTGGDAGLVSVAGTINASGSDAGESGGDIAVYGQDIVVEGGGLLAADAHTVGDGGDIILVAQDGITYEGEIFARGGAEGGDGGFAEISGRGEVNVWAPVFLGAANGAGGTLFIDPTDETIDLSEAAAHSTTLGNGTNVEIVADNDIFVNNAIDATGGSVTGGDLTLVSGRSTEINANITLNDGVFTSNINTQPTGYGGTRAAGTATFTNNATIDTGGGNVVIQSGTLSATTSSVVTGAIDSGGGTIDITTSDAVEISTGTLDGGGGNITVTAGSTITVGDGVGTAIDASAGGNVTLDAGADIIDGNGAIHMFDDSYLTLLAGGSIGAAGAGIEGVDVENLVAHASDGGIYFENSGIHILRIRGMSATTTSTATAADIDILFDGGAIAVEDAVVVTTDGDLNFDSGTGSFGMSGTPGTSIDIDGTATIIADTVAVIGDVRAEDINIAPDSAGRTIRIGDGSAADFSLDANEIANLIVNNTSTGELTIGTTASGNVLVGGGALADFSTSVNIVTIQGATMTFDDSGTAMQMGDGATLTLNLTGAINGGGTSTDIFHGGAGNGVLNIDAGGAVTLATDAELDLSAKAGGAFTLENTGTLNIDELDAGQIDVDASGDVDIDTGTIVAGGDLTITSSGTVTVGDGAGTAIDASAGLYDVTLDAGGGIVDGGGIIDMAGGGTLTLDAGVGVGASGAAIETSGSFSLTGSNGDGDFYVENTGGTLTVQGITVAGVGSIGNLSLTNDNADIDVIDVVLADSDATFEAGTGTFSNSGTITANVGGGATLGGDLTIIADAVAIGATITGENLFVRPDSAGRTIRLADGNTGDFSLDATEIALLTVDNAATGELTIGTTASGNVLVGGGATADFSTSVNIVTIQGATMTFDDSATALQMGNSATLTLNLTGAINGGGTSTDIFHGGAGNGVLNIDAGGAVTLATDAELALNAKAGGAFTLENTGTLNIDELDAGQIDVDASGDVDIDTGTIVAGGDLTITSSGTITVGDGAGTAIDATAGLYDVTLDAGGDIVDGGGRIDMSGATLTMLAVGDIGSTSDAISASGTGYIDFDTGGTVDFENTGNTTITTGSVSAGGDIDIDITGDLTVGTGVGTAIDATGGAIDVALSATGSIVDGGGTIDMAGGTLTLEAGGAVGASGSAIDTSGSFSLTGSAGNGGFYLTSTSSTTLTVGDISAAAAGTATADIDLANGDGAIVFTGTATADGDIVVDADSDISLGAVADVSAGEAIDFGAGGNIETAAGSTLTGGTAILLGAAGDISTSGTVDASAAGVAVTLLSGGTITDAGNTYIFTDGTLRAEAVGDIDLTLSGTSGSTVTAALSAGGNVDFFLRDAGDLTIDAVTSGGGTTTGVTAANGYVDIDVEAGLLTVNEDITATHATGFDVSLSADDMEIGSTVSASGDIFIDPFTDGRDMALNDGTASTLNLTNAEIAFLSTSNTVQFGRAAAGDIFVGGSGSLDLTGSSWSTATLRTDATVSMTAGVETADMDVDVNADLVLTGGTVIDTVNSGTSADVHVTGTIEGTTSGAEALTVTVGAGDITFDSAAGQTTPLGDLALSGHDITVTDIATSGTQSYTATGEVTFGSTYTTDGNAFDLTGGLTLADDVTIDTSVLADTGADITIDDVTNNGFTLNLDAGSDGAISLDTWTNTGAFTGLGTLNIIDSDTTTISGTISGDTLEVFDSSTSVSLLGDVDLGSLLFGAGPYEVILTGSNVFLVNEVVFNNSGDVTLGDNTGDVFVFTGGVDASNGGVIVSGDFTFGGTGLVATSLSLQSNTSFASTGTMLLGTVFGNGYTFTLDGGTTGDITIGTLSNTAGTGTLYILNVDELLLTGAATADTIDIDVAQTSAIFEGLVTVNDFLTGAGSYIVSLFGGASVTNAVNFLNTAGVDIGDEETDVSIFTNGFQSTASETTIAGLVQSEGSVFTFGDVILSADATIDTTLSTPGGAAVNINGATDSAASTAYDLSVTAGNASTATFTGNVGDTEPLGSLFVSALNIILHDVSTVGEQIYQALNSVGGLGQVQLNSTYQTQGADYDLTGNVLIADHATIDTTWSGAYTMGDIRFGGTGGQIDFGIGTGTLGLISGGATSVRSQFMGSLGATNVATIVARDGVSLLGGGTLGEDLIVRAGAFDGDLEANPGQSITFHSPMTIGDGTVLSATGDITFLDEFNTYALFVQLNGHMSTSGLGFVNIEEAFDIGGLTEGLGTSDVNGSIRGVDSDQAASFGNQLETERRDDLLFNGCIVEVGCLNFDPSAIVIPVFDPVIYLYERDGSLEELRYSDLPNTEVWFGLGGAPDIWEERLGRANNNNGDESEGGQ